MSVIISNIDITQYVKQGGISESTQKVYSEGFIWGIEANRSKGAHYVYSVSAQMPTEIKNTIAELIPKDYIKCNVNGNEFYAEMTSFSAAIVIEYGNLAIWDVSFTVSDVNLSDEQEATGLNAINNLQS